MTHASLERHIALVPVAIDGLPRDGRFRGDVQDDGQGRRRQEALNRGQPRAAQSLRLAVRDARRDVPVAHEDQPAIQPALQVGFPFVPIGDVQQLHHIGAVLALALQGARDLFADRGAVIRERHDARFAPVLLQAVAKHLRLRLLAALVEPFKRD